jgi:hypothetical protein
MGSLLWEHRKWVLFYGNIENGFSPKGTDKMGSLLREQTKWGSPRNVGFCVGGNGGRMECQKKSLLGEKKTLNFTFICDFGVVLSLTCVVGLCVYVCVCVCVCVCFCCCCCCCVGKLRSFFRYPTTNTIFPFFFPPFF